MSLHRSTPRHGFTLIELSIVMVVLALLIGTVMAGREMMKGQELKSLTSQAVQIGMAIEQFRAKYGYTPGDFPTATQLWGTSTGCGGVFIQEKATCDGNGNGIIDNSEYVYKFQQLKAAGMIDMSYKNPAGILYGITAPKPGTYYRTVLWNPGDQVDSTYPPSEVYDDAFTLYSTWSTMAIGTLTPLDAHLMDLKSDDGLPMSGGITSRSASGGTCMTGYVAGTNSAVYNVTLDTRKCNPDFMPSLWRKKGTVPQN